MEAYSKAKACTEMPMRTIQRTNEGVDKADKENEQDRQTGEWFKTARNKYKLQQLKANRYWNGKTYNIKRSNYPKVRED